MTRSSTLFWMMVAGAALVACGDDDSGGTGGGGGEGTTSSTSTTSTTTTTSTGSGAQPGPGDFDAAYATSPAFFTNMAGPVMGDSPHGIQQTWYSANIRDLVGLASFTAPEGTVSIKRFDMDGDGTDDGLAVMIKRAPGYDAANGDWYYDMRMLDGTIMSDPPPGPTPMCIDCHAAAAATDYLLATKLD